MTFTQTFHKEVMDELDTFLKEQESRFPVKESLTIDLHCHDYNSNVPDEIMGRILGVPETWLSTDDLIKTLKNNVCATFTVTNHNNARSCYELREKGFDVLTGAEFSCHVPDYNTGIHVLTYGFTPSQEKRLNKLRSDLYRFLNYTTENDIPTIWAHPLYHYKDKGLPPMDFFEKLVLIFERFEVINGQRDTWQNMLVKKWLESLTPGKIHELGKKQEITPDRYCREPYRKRLSGGSDSHMGIFAGQTGTRLHVPDLKEKLKIMSRSQIALEAIKKGEMAPFGSHNDSEKMSVTFLDYFCQIGLNMEDPGLLRMLLHKGDSKEKLSAFAIANAFMELKRHRLTSNFLKIFHDCFSGRVPGFSKRLLVSKPYREIFKEASHMAETRRDNPDEAAATFDQSIKTIFGHLNNILVTRITGKLNELATENVIPDVSINEVVDNFELPVNIRTFFENGNRKNGRHMSSFNLSEFMDGLSFPFLASGVILGSYFTSAKVLYNARPLLAQFSEELGAFHHPERMLWLTDTFDDGNGVAMVLQSMLKEIQERDLPIDILVASSSIKPQDHLIVVPPQSEFVLPFYEHQPIRIPNILDIHQVFKDGEYDRIMCSTEGPMGAVALFLKNAYTVPAHFYVHTDWMMFARQVLNFDQQNIDRMRRLLRAYYGSFDSLFVLNNDQRKWLMGHTMGFREENVHLTAHWAEEMFRPMEKSKEEIFGVSPKETVLLFAGRVSEEKGVMELPKIYEKIRADYPSVKIAVAGKGPAEAALKEAMPEGIFLGWVDHEKLPEVYSAADMLLLPSKFDTFGCVVLEALSCGCPVTAYKTKGPRDIIEDGKCGYLVKNRTEMTAAVKDYLADRRKHSRFSKAALKRAKAYAPDTIIEKLLKDCALDSGKRQ